MVSDGDTFYDSLVQNAYGNTGNTPFFEHVGCQDVTEMLSSIAKKVAREEDLLSEMNAT